MTIKKLNNRNSAAVFQKAVRSLKKNNKKNIVMVLKDFKEDIKGYSGKFNIEEAEYDINARNRRVLGIDIKGYSKFHPLLQLLATIVTYEAINDLIDSENAREFITTGDGFLISFYKRSSRAKNNKQKGVSNHAELLEKSIEQFIEIKKQLNFVYDHLTFQDSLCKPMEIKTPEIRGAVAFGKSYSIEVADRFTSDKQAAEDAVGEAVIRCSRLLSLDHGTHFIIDKRFYDQCPTENQMVQINALTKDWEVRSYLSQRNVSLPFIGIVGEYNGMEFGQKEPEPDWIPIPKMPNFNKYHSNNIRKKRLRKKEHH